ncbi:hypothetical protein BASA61_001339 [Batrachochytrium salamandrivorans]|nr:hypothetical protein BASA61_001339 [Batrachochytrium salamandrivorans]KAH9245329.1 hypothetical protein BASA81_017194 [Batrachochytrium salamandrivorans]KAH9274793.1 hypothetical protein BASA83_003000 [Batrachochytrium salamandrivorans]
MKLISFAAISLLAITVSAYPRQSPDAQEMDQSQDAAQDMQIPQDASQDMQQSDQHMAQGGLENLEKAYEELENRTFEIYNSIWMLEQTKLELRSEMQRLGGELSNEGIIIHEEGGLWGEYNVNFDGWKKACADIKAELEELEKVKEEQDGVKAELDALEEIH